MWEEHVHVGIEDAIEWIAEELAGHGLWMLEVALVSGVGTRFLWWLNHRKLYESLLAEDKHSGSNSRS